MENKISEFSKLDDKQNALIVKVLLNNSVDEQKSFVTYKKELVENLIYLNFLDKNLIDKIFNFPLPINLYRALKKQNQLEESWEVEDLISRDISNFGNVKMKMICFWHTYISGMWTWKMNPILCNLLINTLNDAPSRIDSITILSDLIGIWTFFSDVVYTIAPLITGIAAKIKNLNYHDFGAEVKMIYFSPMLISESDIVW